MSVPKEQLFKLQQGSLEWAVIPRCIKFKTFPVRMTVRVVIQQIFIEPLLDARPCAVYTSKQNQHGLFFYKVTLPIHSPVLETCLGVKGNEKLGTALS